LLQQEGADEGNKMVERDIDNERDAQKEFDDSQMGCYTGDCPHEKQVECDEAIARHEGKLCDSTFERIQNLKQSKLELVHRLNQLKNGPEKVLKEIYNHEYDIGRIGREVSRLEAQLKKAQNIEDMKTAKILGVDEAYQAAKEKFVDHKLDAGEQKCDTENVLDFRSGYYNGFVDAMTFKPTGDPVARSGMLATESGQRRFKFLVLFLAGEMLPGVDLELRRCVKELMLDNKYLSEELVKLGGKELAREYWENWANL
jgi:hypothetical protein